MKIFRSIIILFSAIILYSCEAPRTNPLDPNNPDSQFATVYGYIKTTAVPIKAIVGAKVTWRNQNITVMTDANGYYNFTGIPKKDGNVVFEADGYYRDSVAVQITGAQKNLGDHKLNSIPRVTSLSLYTIVENRYSISPNTFFIVKAKIADAENEVDSVFLRCTPISFYKKIAYNSSTQTYEGTYLPSDFNASSIDAVIGQTFELVVKTKLRPSLDIIGSSDIKRIIRQEVIPYNPSNKELVGSNPTLLWQRYLPGFNFTYTIEIYTDDSTKTLVWQKQNVSEDTIQIVPDKTLSQGEYYWVIWCIDDYQDRAQSRPASFIVQ